MDLRLALTVIALLFPIHLAAVCEESLCVNPRTPDGTSLLQVQQEVRIGGGRWHSPLIKTDPLVQGGDPVPYSRQTSEPTQSTETRHPLSLLAWNASNAKKYDILEADIARTRKAMGEAQLAKAAVISHLDEENKQGDAEDTKITKEILALEGQLQDLSTKTVTVAIRQRIIGIEAELHQKQEIQDTRNKRKHDRISKAQREQAGLDEKISKSNAEIESMTRGQMACKVDKDVQESCSVGKYLGLLRQAAAKPKPTAIKEEPTTEDTSFNVKQASSSPRQTTIFSDWPSTTLNIYFHVHSHLTAKGQEITSRWTDVECKHGAELVKKHDKIQLPPPMDAFVKDWYRKMHP